VSHFSSVYFVRGREVEDGQFNERVVESAEVLNPFGESVIADQPVPFLSFGMVQPFNALVDEVSKNFNTDEVSDSCFLAGLDERYNGVVAEESPNNVK